MIDVNNRTSGWQKRWAGSWRTQPARSPPPVQPSTKPLPCVPQYCVFFKLSGLNINLGLAQCFDFYSMLLFFASPDWSEWPRTWSGWPQTYQTTNTELHKPWICSFWFPVFVTIICAVLRLRYDFVRLGRLRGLRRDWRIFWFIDLVKAVKLLLCSAFDNV